MDNFNIVGMAETIEGVFGSQVEAFFATELKAASDAAGAGLTDEEVKYGASGSRKLVFSGLNKGLGLIGKK